MEMTQEAVRVERVVPPVEAVPQTVTVITTSRSPRILKTIKTNKGMAMVEVKATKIMQKTRIVNSMRAITTT